MLSQTKYKATPWLAKMGLCVLATTLACATTQAEPRKQKQQPTEIGSPTPNPDILLADVFQNLSNNRLQAAQTKIDELIEAYPHFQLAHLIRGDLLLMHTRPVADFGSGSGVLPERLKELRDEAAVRLKSYLMRPPVDQLPRAVIQLREDQKQVLVVDAKKSRLYVYENEAGQLRMTSDHYISQGKFGIHKFKEGDQKTPIGVYYITSHLSGSKLPDFYGPGALPLNYPNDWDKLHGRSGSGIWLHGMPSNSFSRPPLASDGCVVLTNQDFLKIAAAIDIGKTPVIISEQIEFEPRAKWQSERQALTHLLEEWRSDLESLNVNRIFANYSRNFKTAQGDTLNNWFARQRQTWDGWSSPVIRLKDVSLFRYPGKDEMVVGTFTQETITGKTRVSIRKRQYWLKEANKWRIVYETNV